MKKVFTAFIIGTAAALLTPVVSHAESVGSWSVLSENETYKAISPEFTGLAVTLKSSVVAPEVLSWQKSPSSEDVWILKYSAGVAGTSSLYRFERSSVISIKRKVVLGDELVKVEPVNDEPRLLQPVWTWGIRHVRIFNPETEATSEIRW